VCVMIQQACVSHTHTLSLALFLCTKYAPARSTAFASLTLSLCMLLARSLSALILPRLALSSASTAARSLRGPYSVSTLSFATHNLGSFAAPPLGLYTSSFVNRSHSVRNMGSDSSKTASDPSAFPKGKSDSEWRTILSPQQVCHLFLYPPFCKSSIVAPPRPDT
jgi:hypothetical protein